MSSANLQDRRVLVAGVGLMACAEQGLPGADIQPVSPEALAGFAAQGLSADLVLIDADDVDPAKLAAAIRGLAQAANPPAVVLFAAHLPSSLARDLFKLKQVDVLEPP